MNWQFVPLMWAGCLLLALPAGSCIVRTSISPPIWLRIVFCALVVIVGLVSSFTLLEFAATSPSLSTTLKNQAVLSAFALAVTLGVMLGAFLQMLRTSMRKTVKFQQFV